MLLTLSFVLSNSPLTFYHIKLFKVSFIFMVFSWVQNLFKQQVVTSLVYPVQWLGWHYEMHKYPAFPTLLCPYTHIYVHYFVCWYFILQLYWFHNTIILDFSKLNWIKQVKSAKSKCTAGEENQQHQNSSLWN
jgi:hypothetical protein